MAPGQRMAARPPSSNVVKVWAQAASTGSPLTRVRWTTAPAMTSKMRSIWVAVSVPWGPRGGRPAGVRRVPGRGGGRGPRGTSAGPRWPRGSAAAGLRRGWTRRRRPSGPSWLRGVRAAPRTAAPRPRCRPGGFPGRAAPVRRRAPRPHRRPARSCLPSGGRGWSWRRRPGWRHRPSSARPSPVRPGRPWWLPGSRGRRRRCGGGPSSSLKCRCAWLGPYRPVRRVARDRSVTGITPPRGVEACGDRTVWSYATTRSERAMTTGAGGDPRREGHSGTAVEAPGCPRSGGRFGGRSHFLRRGGGLTSCSHGTCP